MSVSFEDFQVIKNLEDFEVKRIKLDELGGKMIFR